MKITYTLDIHTLCWSDEDVLNNLSEDVLKKYKLTGGIKKEFNRNIYKAINYTYPDKFNKKDFKNSLSWN